VPPAGNQPSEKEKMASSTIPSQNSGMARVVSTNGMATFSTALPRRHAR
jgi:hypothetical protein